MTSFAQACKICGDKFTSIRGLNIHLNVHKDQTTANQKNPTPEKSTVTNETPKNGSYIDHGDVLV